MKLDPKKCREIYRQHREAIDLIIEYGVTSPLDDAIDEFLHDKPMRETFRNNSRFFFLPDALPMKQIERNRYGAYSQPICFYFIFLSKENSLTLTTDIWIDDSKECSVLLKILTKSGYLKIPNVELVQSTKYEKVTSSTIRFEDWEDTKKIVEGMNRLFRQRLKDIKND